jgi:hypothetical protein
MQDHEEKWYFMHFENKFLKLTREQFQAWFVEIMECAYPGDFAGTRQGTTKGGGDLNCDGFLTSEGAVYAVYAPRQCSLKELNDKIAEDCRGAISNFGDRMRRWVFVHNDEQISSETIKALADLKIAFPNVDIGTFIKKEELWAIVRSLPPETLCRMFPQFPIATTVDKLGFKDLQPVLQFIEKQPLPIDLPVDPPDPDKLAHNGLSDYSEDWLRIGRRKEKLVGIYFDGSHDPELGEKIAQAFRDRYRRLKDAQWPSDSILQELYGFAGGFKFLQQNEQAAVLTVLSYYFERCDIFENAPSGDVE